MMNISTVTLIKSQFIEIVKNYKFFFIISLPVFFVCILSSYYEYLYIDPSVDISLFKLMYSLHVQIPYLVTCFVIINIHRFIILKEDLNYYSYSKKKFILLKYFLFGNLLLILAIGPGILTYYFITHGINYFESSNQVWIFYIISIFLILLSLVIFFITYPFLALGLPTVAVGKKIKILEIWKLSKGFRKTLFLQILYIFGFHTITSISMSLIFFFNTDVYPLYFEIFDKLYYYFFEVLAVTCLSKTYLIWSEKNNI